MKLTKPTTSSDKEYRLKYFKQECLLKHGSKYTYPNLETEFINSRSTITVNCSVHGDFTQEARRHLSENGRGCQKCARENTKKSITKTLKDFKKSAVNIHGEKYSYEESIYVNCSTKMKIYCNKHKIYFEQMPRTHLDGSGCQECAKEDRIIANKKSLEKFILDAKLVHGDKYIYDDSEYSTCHEEINIRCKNHGVFTQKPNRHLNGDGCPKCSKETNTYWRTPEKWEEKAKNSINFESFKFYIMLLEKNYEEFYKFGITFRNIDVRIKDIKKSKNVKLLYLIESSSKNIMDIENLVKEFVFLKELKHFSDGNFHGYSECFKKSDNSLDIVMNEIKKSCSGFSELINNTNN